MDFLSGLKSLQVSNPSNALSGAPMTLGFNTEPIYFKTSPTEQAAQAFTTITPTVAVIALVGVLIWKGKI